jgi:L-fuculose-phosphate aldolase
MRYNSLNISSIIRKAVLECLAEVRAHCVVEEDPRKLFESEETRIIKEEMVRAARKLWARQYVDGNGGNLSVRLSSQYVLCTPTLLSKGDLVENDLVLVDLENRQICGTHPQTSEILLHLEIYKTEPTAKAVVHCHPPYATAHAVAGVIPQGNLVPEQEVFVGPVALTPYETPGTLAFAKTIVPVVRQHNTILLANHGVVCWADTITHAEWYIEVVETYCMTLMIAQKLASSLPEIPPAKVNDLLTLKKGLGLPDARLPLEPCVEEATLREYQKDALPSSEETEALIASIAEKITALLERKA